MDFVNKYTWSIHIALNYLGPKALIDLDGSISIGLVAIDVWIASDSFNCIVLA